VDHPALPLASAKEDFGSAYMAIGRYRKGFPD